MPDEEVVQQNIEAPVTPENTVNKDRLLVELDTWWNRHFPGSPVSRNVAAWNHANAAFSALKALIHEL